MSFDYEIVADGSKSNAVIKSQVTGLQGITDAAKQTGAALTNALGGPGLKNSQGQFVATAVAAQKTRDRVADMCDQWERQDALLEKIQGPDREYQANMRALDSLFKENTISVAAYKDQVDQLNASLGRSNGKQPGKVDKPSPGGGGGGGGEGGGLIEGDLGSSVLKSAGGEVGGMLDSLISKGNLEAAALVGIAMEAINLGNEYIELSNKAQAFTDATHTTNDILNEQLDLGEQLHSSLDVTMETYNAVRDGTDALNLSHEQQIDLTRELGEAVQLSGKQLSDAGGVMQRLSYAFASGTVSGRELKSIMTEYPEIAQVWTKQLGLTRAQIIQMADDGKISVEGLMNAFQQAGPELDEKFGKRSQTLGQYWDHFKDVLVLTIGKIMESTGIVALLGAALEILGDILKAIALAFDIIVGVITAIVDAFSALADVIQDACDDFTDLIGLTDTYNDTAKNMNVTELMSIARGAQMIAMINTQSGAFSFLAARQTAIKNFVDTFTTLPQRINSATTAVQDLGRQFGLAEDSWEGAPTAFARGVKLVMDQSAKVGEAKNELQALNDLWAKMSISADEYITKRNAALAVINGGAAPAFAQEDATMRKAYGDLVDLEIAKGQMMAGRFKQQYRAIMTTLNGGEAPAIFKITDEIFEPLRQYKLEEQALQALHDSGSISAQQYARELHTLWQRDPNMVQYKNDMEEQVRLYDQAADAAKRLKEAQRLGIAPDQRSALPMINALATATPKGIGENDETYKGVKGTFTRAPAAVPPSEIAISAERERQTELLKEQDEMQAKHDALLAQSGTVVDKYTDDLVKVDMVEKDGTLTTEEKTLVMQTLHDKYDDMQGSLAAYQKDMKAATGLEQAGVYTKQELAQKQQELTEKYREFKTPQDDYTAGMLKIEQAQKSGLSSADALEDASRKLRMEVGIGTFGDGVIDGLQKIKAEVGDTASIMSKAMTSAFDAINTSIEDMVTTGTLDINALGTALEKITIDTALKSVESSIATAASSKIVDQTGAVATGTTVGGTASSIMGAAALGIGTTIGTTAAGIILAASASSAGISAASEAGSFAVAAYAGGTSYTVGGPGGVDRSLQTFWASRGEQVTVENPTQQSSRRDNNAPAARVVNQITNHVGDDELLGSVETHNGARKVLNVLRRQGGAARSMLRSNSRR